LSIVSISPDKLHQWVREVWLAAGSNEREATLTADHLVKANLTGHDSHGVQMIAPYIESLLLGGLTLNQRLAIEIDANPILKVNGQAGMGQAVTYEAMQLAIARAKTHGVCILGLHNSHHLGRVGHWAEMATQEGLVSIHFTNVRATPLVAPHDGVQARFVTNPVTVGIPRNNQTPIVLDFATSAIAAGKVRVAYLKGAQTPAGALIDAQGNPTNDASVLFEPPLGALLTAAGHKGFGLSLVCELLAGALLGEPTLRTSSIPTNAAIINNMLAIVFDPARMGSAENFQREMVAFEQWVKSAQAVPASDGVKLPGEPEQINTKARSAGIPLDQGAVAKLNEAITQLNQSLGRNAPVLIAQ
jgi:hydroxycarboxylate dehydrogenase B